MAKPKLLKSVIYNLLHAFISRNNDIKGYWALGKLYKLALKNNSKKIKIDLLNGTLTYPDLEFKKMIEHYQLYMEKQMINSGFYFELLSTANIEIVFDDKPPKLSLDRLTLRGEPFSCTGTFAYENNGCNQVTVVGYCAPHDPTVESRSGRYNENNYNSSY